CAAAAVLPCQQANTPTAAMTVDGHDGPVYPNQVNVRVNTTSTVAIQGLSFSPFAIIDSGNATLQVGAANYFGYVFDLPTTPPPKPISDGFQDPAYATDVGGAWALPVAIPSSVAVGTQAAFQTVIADAAAPFGYALTAATAVAAVAGPTVVPITMGNEGTQ